MKKWQHNNIKILSYRVYIQQLHSFSGVLKSWRSLESRDYLYYGKGSWAKLIYASEIR